MADEIAEKRTPKKKKRCFVVGPIGADGSDIRDHADWLLDMIILPVFDQHYPDFEVDRSDRITTPGMIDSQMINRLLDDDLVIADMSHLNPNAFYELGVRHVIQKPIIHMFLEGTEIPFDVKPYRAISFGVKNPAEINKAKTLLHAALQEIFAEGYAIENPITRARAHGGEQESGVNDNLSLGEIANRIDSAADALAGLRINSLTTDIVGELRMLSRSLKSHEADPSDVKERDVSDVIKEALEVLAGVFKVVDNSRTAGMIVAGAAAAIVGAVGWPGATCAALIYGAWLGPDAFRAALEHAMARLPSPRIRVLEGQKKRLSNKKPKALSKR